MTLPTRFDFLGDLGSDDDQSVSEASVVLWMIAGYIALVPTITVIPSLGPYNEKRALQIGLLVVIAAVLLGSASARREWLSTFTALPLTARGALGIVLGLGILSAARAPSSFYAFLEVGHFLLMFVAAGVVASAIRRGPEWGGRMLLGAVAVSGVLYAVYFTVGYGMHLAWADIGLWPDGGVNYVNIRFFNHYQTWTLPLLVGGFLALPKGRWGMKGSMFGIIVLWWALVFASNVRGTVVAVVLAAVGIGLLFRGRSKKWLAVLGASVLGGIVLHSVLFPAGGAPPVVEKFGDPSKYPWRIRRWMSSLEMAGAHPWIGAGPMHFAWPPFRFTTGASPHNALMQWLAEWGIPSTIIMSSLVCWGGWSWVRQEMEPSQDEPETETVVRLTLTASVLAGTAHAMVSGIIVTPLSQMLLVLVAGWAWGRYRHKWRLNDARLTAYPHAILCILLAGSVGIVGSSLRDLSTIQERRSVLIHSAEGNTFSPRYWGQGYICLRDFKGKIHRTTPR